MKLSSTRNEAGLLGLQVVADWLADIWTFLKDWCGESWKEVAKWGTALWGLVAIAGTLIWTVLTHIVPLLTLLLDTINGLVTGTWNFAPPAGITNVLAIANTFTPLQEAMGYAAAYGLLKGTLALYRFIKNLIPTEAGT
jgi:hypothetical protein